MPVAGLPAATETTLNELLTENTVSSWKVAGERDSTVVFIRLKPQAHSTTSNMASRSSQHHQSSKFFWKKLHTRMLRNQETDKQRRAQSAELNQASVDSFDLSLGFLGSSPDSRHEMSTHNTDTAAGKPTDTEITDCMP